MHFKYVRTIGLAWGVAGMAGSHTRKSWQEADRKLTGMRVESCQLPVSYFATFWPPLATCGPPNWPKSQKCSAKKLTGSWQECHLRWESNPVSFLSAILLISGLPWPPVGPPIDQSQRKLRLWQPLSRHKLSMEREWLTKLRSWHALSSHKLVNWARGINKVEVMAAILEW